MDELKNVKKETVKDVLTTSSFEYTSDIQNKFVNQKGKVNLAFGMRCFFWLAFATIFILILNIVGINIRVKNAAKGIAVETQGELKKYENNLNNRIKQELNDFENPVLVEKLENDSRKILGILLNVQNEGESAYYIKTNGEVIGIDIDGNSKITRDTEIYKELKLLLEGKENTVESEKWFYEKTFNKYVKLHGYKVFNADGTLNGVVAYTNSISEPISMLTNIHVNVSDMKFYIFDENKQLIYTNNENESSIDILSKKINHINKDKTIVWDNSKTKQEDDVDIYDSRIKKNEETGSLIAQLAKNIGNNLKRDTVLFTVNDYNEDTGYTIFVDYRRTVLDVIRNLTFFYTAMILIVLLVLYVMTYYYKFSKIHATMMFRTISVGMLGAVIVTIGTQIVSYMISSSNMARVEGTILTDAVITNVTPEEYLEYIAFVNQIDLETEIETKKDIINKNLANYYSRFGLESIETTLITKESYLSERAKTQIAKNGVYTKVRKSGGERYIEIETIEKGFVRNHDVWFKLNAHIETKARTIFEPMIVHFGQYDGFEIMLEDRSFKLDANSQYYSEDNNPIWTKTDSVSNLQVETSKTFVVTKTKINLTGFSYVVSYKNYDITFVFLVVAISMIIYIGMYFDIVFTIRDTKDEDVQDDRFKHLLEEWLSGNITIIDEGDKSKQSEYDEILLERLRKTNIDRLTLTKKEQSKTSDDFVDEDETYAKVKKEKDIFGISLFNHKRTKMSETKSKNEIYNENPQGTITELKESVVSSIESSNNDGDNLFDAEKLKVAQERLAIKQVLDEIEDNKNGKTDAIKLFEEEDDDDFSVDDLELSSKDEKLNEKFDKK